MSDVADPLEIFSVVDFDQWVVIAIAFVLFFVVNGKILAHHDRRLGRQPKLGFHHYVATLNAGEWIALALNGIACVTLMVASGSYV